MQARLISLTLVQLARLLGLVRRIEPVELDDSREWGLLIRGQGVHPAPGAGAAARTKPHPAGRLVDTPAHHVPRQGGSGDLCPAHRPASQTEGMVRVGNAISRAAAPAMFLPARFFAQLPTLARACRGPEASMWIHRSNGLHPVQ